MSHDQEGQAAEETRYVDPNSGAAPQPGGFAAPAPVARDAEDAAPAEPKSEEPQAKSEESEDDTKAKGKARKA